MDSAVGKNKTVCFRMEEENYESLQRALKKNGLTVTDFFVQKAEEYLNSIILEHEMSDYGNKIVTKAMHRALFYALEFQREEILTGLMEAEEMTRYLVEEEEKNSVHLILTEEGDIQIEDDIPRSLREALRKGEALILYTFKPVCILPTDISSAEVIDSLYFDEEAEEQKEFLEFLKGYMNIGEDDTVKTILNSCTPEGIVEYVMEFQYNWDPNSSLYDEMKGDFDLSFDMDSRIEEAQLAINGIDLNDFEVIK